MGYQTQTESLESVEEFSPNTAGVVSVGANHGIEKAPQIGKLLNYRF